MQSFEEKLEGILATDPAASKLVESVARRGFGRDWIIQILEDVTSPGLPKKLKRAERHFKSSAPARKHLSRLAVRLERDAMMLEKSFANPLMKLHPKSQGMINLAQLLRIESSVVQRFPLANIGKLFSYKAFWQRLPLFLLCERLQAPQVVRFQEVQDLLVYAWDARGQAFEFDRSVARRYRRFTKTLQGRLILSILVSKSKSKWRILATKF